MKKLEICPDCGELKELGVRTGICRQCSVRKSNCAHRNVPYVALVDEDEIGLKRASTRRKGGSVTKTNKVKTNIEKSEIKGDSKELYSKETKKKVIDDITYNFKVNKIELPKNMNFDTAFKVLSCVLSGIANISEYLKAEDILNKLERDYKHLYESSKTKEEMISNSEIYKCFLDERRDVKTVISEYEAGGYIFKELADNKKFMDKFETANDFFQRVHKMNSEGLYRQESDSQIVKNADFCIGKKSETNRFGKSKYSVTIKPVTPNQDLFQRCVYAENEKEAINNVLDFIKKINYKIAFKNPDGITCVKLTSDNDSDNEKEYL